MRGMFRGAALAVLLVASGGAGKPPVTVVAAENFYGDVARQIAGPDAAVTSILSNPDQDPHMFEASPSVARDLANARIVVANGAEYDPWIGKLLGASRSATRTTITVAELVHARPGGNPHLWYDPATMPAYAQALAAALAAADPAHAAGYEARLQSFLASLQPLTDKVRGLRGKIAGTPVTATEPVFGPMAEALGLTMRNQRFQLAMMNDTEPSARDIAAFENDLKDRKVRVLIYNNQVSEKLTERLRDLATKAQVPTVGVTETMPAGVTFQDWILGELDALDKALSGAAS